VLSAVLITAMVFFSPRPATEREADGEINGTGHYTDPAYPSAEPDPTEPEPTGEVLLFAPAALGGIQITPLSASERGVSLDSAFLITSDVKTLTAEHLEAYLSVPCGEVFTVEENDGGIFTLRFGSLLAHHRIYNFVYGPSGYTPASHAFQTVDRFRITASSPANASFDIPTNAGIEITFSQPLAGDFEDAFNIYPSVQGRFHQRGNTHIFASSSMQPGTAYTVTIRQGLTSAEGEVLDEDYTFTFVTRWGSGQTPSFSLRGEAYETFLPWDEVFIALDISRNFTARNFTVSVYELYTAAHFIDFKGTHTGTRVAEYEITAVEIDVSEWQSLFYLFLGESLPEGYYVAEIRSTWSTSREVVYKFIQISSLSVYSLAIAGEAIFWVHDAVTGLPAEGARIQVGEGHSFLTDREGIAITSTRQDSRTPILIEYGETLPFAYAQPTFGRRPLLASDRFLFYMYTDRPVYRPNDTVDVFGAVMPRYGHTHLPTDRFTLHIGDMMEIPIELDAFNAFALRVPVTGMFGWPEIEVRANGERLMSAWPQFIDYANHAFVLRGEWDKTAYDIDEYAFIELNVTSFAGMPIEGVVLRMDELSFTTNENGVASGSMRTERAEWRSHWMPYWEYHWIWASGDAQVSQGIPAPRIIAPSDIMLEHEWDGTSLILNANKILVDRLDAHHRDLPPWTSIDTDTFRGESVDIEFTIRVTRNVTTRTIRSQRYDHINRRTVTTYTYTTAVEPNYRTIRGHTVNGQAIVIGLPRSDDPMIRYDFDITYDDTRKLASTVRVWSNSLYTSQGAGDTSIRFFNFEPEENPLRIGQTTQVSLTEGRIWHGWDGTVGETTPIENGRILAVMVNNDGILSVNTGSPSGVPITFTEACIYNTLVMGAYFDGRYIFPVTNPATLTFDTIEREIEIDLTFCREGYKPGDEVTLDIVSAPHAQVLISVVDESAFLGRWNDADFLPRFYQSARLSIWSFNHSQFASHTQHEFGGEGYHNGWGGDGGDGGIDDFRDDFTDNPVFELIRTDANGRASLTFILPHQVTSWRVTAIALTPDGYGGDVREQVISALDFYVDLLLTTEYIIGDDIAAAARVHGTREPVDFTFEVLQDGVSLYTHRQTAARRTEFNAGKLPIGEYIMRVTAVSAHYRDAVELPFSVVRSDLIIENRIRGQLSPESNELNPATLTMRDLPVQVSLTNAAIRPLTRILFEAGDARSPRTDARAAAAFTHEFFTGEADLGAFRAGIHHHTGGIPEMIYGDTDTSDGIYYTARFAASFPEFVNPHEIRRFIQADGSRRATSATERAARLLALAAVGDPVLLCIQNEITQLGEGDYFAWLYLTAALVAIGDDTGAKRLYTGALIPPPAAISEQERETSGTLRLFIQTALDPQAALDYINRGTPNRFVSDIPERVNFVRRVTLSGGTVSEIGYFLHGETRTVRLENFDRHHLYITRGQFEALDLTPISGETEYHITFFGYDHTHWDAEHDRIDIRRTVTPAQNGLYRVEMRVNLPPDVTGSFVIYDRIPGNMRFAPAQQRWQRGFFFSVRHTQRQLVEISFFSNHQSTSTRVFHYFVSPLFNGDMATGTTYVISRDANNPVWGMTR